MLVEFDGQASGKGKKEIMSSVDKGRGEIPRLNCKEKVGKLGIPEHDVGKHTHLHKAFAGSCYLNADHA